MAGRPSDFTPELADRICQQLAEGVSLRTVCKAEDMPNAATVFRWLRTNDAFCEQYTRAKQESSDAMAEDMMDIADDGSNDWMERLADDGQKLGWQLNGEHVNRSRLRIETRKWLASKLKPKKYGDSTHIDIDHRVRDLSDKPLTTDEWNEAYGSGLEATAGTPKGAH